MLEGVFVSLLEVCLLICLCAFCCVVPGAEVGGVGGRGVVLEPGTHTGQAFCSAWGRGSEINSKPEFETDSKTVYDYLVTIQSYDSYDYSVLLLIIRLFSNHTII